MLNPETSQAMAFEAGPDVVKSLEWAGMTAGCRERMVEVVAEGSGFSGAEELFKQGLAKLGELPVD